MDSSPSAHGAKAIALLTIVQVLLCAPCCGPSKQEIRASEEARLQLEARVRAEAEARRQAEEARLARLRASEAAGAEAGRQGRFQEALEHFRAALGVVARYSEEDRRLREAVIKVVLSMPAPPPQPESVLRNMVRAETRLKMGGGSSFAEAAGEMEQVVRDAPWLANAYYNLGVVQAQAGDFDKAIQNLGLYLVADPRSPNADAVRAKLYEFEIMKEERARLNALVGTWVWEGTQVSFALTVEGQTIRLVGEGLTIEVRKKGNDLEGLITSSSVTDGTAFGSTGIPCTHPGETVPITGVIGADWRTIDVRWMGTDYNFDYDIGNDSVYSRANRKCRGVSLAGKSGRAMRLVKTW